MQVRYVAVATRGTTYHVVDPLLDMVVPPGQRIPTLCGRWAPHPTSTPPTLKTVPADANLCARCAKSLDRLRRSETDAEDLAR